VADRSLDQTPPPVEEPASSVAKAAIRSNATLAALTMEGAKPWQRLIVYICYGIILATIILLVIPPYDSIKQVVGFFLCVAALLTAGGLVLHQLRQVKGGNGQVPRPKNIQLSGADREKIQEVLKEARKKVFQHLVGKNPSITDEQIRANVFFPEYGPSDRPDDYLMRIRPGLHLKMDREAELGLTLGPGQGVTGQVFQRGEPMVAKRLLESDGGGWDAVYDITPELAAVIHPDLKWIISMPIKGADRTPFGVMNVDGLIHSFEFDVLYECAHELWQLAFIIGGLAQGH